MPQNTPQPRPEWTPVHVDPEALARMQKAMQEDLAWRRAGGPCRTRARIHFGVTYDSPTSGRIVPFRGRREWEWDQ